MENKDTTIKSWWRKVTHTNNSNNNIVTQKQDEVFGVPLQQSLKCARAAIAYVDNDVQYVGFIPVIVAKCGSFLKDQGLYTEGVFRMSGSAKRIGQLQQIFNTSPDYGKQLDWKGYSVHDAANVLRRFLNYLPEPVITHNLYQPFRSVILSNSTEEEKISEFQNLIEQLPEAHQYLLFYILDLLSLFSQSVHITKMDSFNLASVFTPGMLLSPDHALNPAQYKTSQKVIRFLIEHQHCFKMPKASWYTIQKPQPEESAKEENEEKAAQEKETETETEKNQYSAFRKHHHYSIPVRSASVILSSHHNHYSHNQHSHCNQDNNPRAKRAKTMPSRRSRYGRNDPLQIVQLNKSIESGHISPPL